MDCPTTRIRLGRHDKAELLEAFLEPLGNVASELATEATPLEHLVRSAGGREAILPY